MYCITLQDVTQAILEKHLPKCKYLVKLLKISQLFESLWRYIYVG